MAETHVPGASIALIKDGALYWNQGFGMKDATSTEPVDENTVFEAGSMSKPVFAYYVLQLTDRGLLNLDVPLTRYVPGRFVEGDPRLDLVTARHVLSHTSGFQNWRSHTEPLRIQFTPGERFLYSGEGYFYLQSVTTHRVGRTFPEDCSSYEAGVKVCATDIDDQLRASVLSPLGMTSSGYVWNDAFERHTAHPHDRDGKPLPKQKPNRADAARYASAGGLHTTSTDFARFVMAVIDPRRPTRSHLEKGTLREMIRPQVEVDTTPEYSVSWGLGWRLARAQTINVINHGGDNRGFHAFAEACPELKSGYVILTNGDGGVDLIQKLAPYISRRIAHQPVTG